jgi:hypothetical protein
MAAERGLARRNGPIARKNFGGEMKQLKSARELGEIISTWLNVPTAVHPDAVAGWEPRVLAAPAVAAKYQPLAEDVAVDLRRAYDLRST